MSDAHPCHNAMLQAVELARKARWRTYPNPCVGAVIMKDGLAVACGWHRGPGLPHAEVEAIRDAQAKGIDLADCVMVVTLEPCRHTGKTPPCTEAILASGIRRLVVGALDPNPNASGGAELLRAQGLEVQTGVALRECMDLLDEFLVWQKTPLPYVILKLAASLDGRIATRTGHSQWISGEESRAFVHELRSRVQAVIIGGNTFYADNPRLTCRLPGCLSGQSGQPYQDAQPSQDVQSGQSDQSGQFRQPLAVVISSRLPDVRQDMYLVHQRPESLIFWTTLKASGSPAAAALRDMGVRVLGLPARVNEGPAALASRLDLAPGLATLREEYGCHYALCEGGGRLGLSLLERGLARELRLHLAPTIFADNAATPLFDGCSPLLVSDALTLRLTETAQCGRDLHLTLRPSSAPWAARENAKT